MQYILCQRLRNKINVCRIIQYESLFCILIILIHLVSQNELARLTTPANPKTSSEWLVGRSTRVELFRTRVDSRASSLSFNPKLSNLCIEDEVMNCIVMIDRACLYEKCRILKFLL